MIRRALIVDTETTGINPETDEVIELGTVLYSVEHRTTLVQVSTLTSESEDGANPAEMVNGIPPAVLASLATDPIAGAPSFSLFSDLVRCADVIVAHRAEFDRAFLTDFWHSKPWLCTKFDFAWPKQVREGESLVNLALQHGIGVSSAHRALTDCQLIAALFDRMHLYGCDLQAMFARAMRPKAIFRAVVSFDERDKAKSAGFLWDPAAKQWTKRLAIEDAAQLPFRTVQLAEVA